MHDSIDVNRLLKWFSSILLFFTYNSIKSSGTFVSNFVSRRSSDHQLQIRIKANLKITNYEKVEFNVTISSHKFIFVGPRENRCNEFWYCRKVAHETAIYHDNPDRNCEDGSITWYGGVPRFVLKRFLGGIGIFKALTRLIFWRQVDSYWAVKDLQVDIELIKFDGLKII